MCKRDRRNAGLCSQSESLARLFLWAKENIRGVDAGRAGADYGNAKFIVLSHKLKPNAHAAPATVFYTSYARIMPGDPSAESDSTMPRGRPPPPTP